jgi:hypothetical protein
MLNSQLIDKGYSDSKGFTCDIRKDLAIDLFKAGVKFDV